MDEPAILASCPDFLSIGGMLKAHPQEEGGRRYVYMEASNEGLDVQGEVVAAKALAESADYYLKYGNLDLDHYTRIGARLAIPDYTFYEVGQPRDVGQRGRSTFVKAEVYQGEGQAADKANMLWQSMTAVRPPLRWYPSVGGAVLGKSDEIDPDTLARKTIITATRWNNIGLSKTPVNQHVRDCAVIPIGVFAKCMTPGGLDIFKALEAGYGTDSAALTGGAALRTQSLDDAGPISYWSLRDKLSSDLLPRKVGQTARALTAHAVQHYGLNHDEAAQHVERFMGDLRKGLKQRKAS
jgi:hypothetical protein